MSAKKCPEDKILNPATGRCVLKTGAIGKKLLAKLAKPTKPDSLNNDVLDIIGKHASPKTKRTLKEVNKHFKNTIIASPAFGRKNGDFLLQYIKTNKKVDLTLSVYNRENYTLIVKKIKDYVKLKDGSYEKEYRVVFIKRTSDRTNVPKIIGKFVYKKHEDLQNIKLSQIIMKSQQKYVNIVLENLSSISRASRTDNGNISEWEKYIHKM